MVRNAVRDADVVLKSARNADGSLTLPIDPVKLGREMGVNIYQAPMPNNVSGMIARAEPYGDVDVILNSEHAPVRQRFTCAHELGHFVDVVQDDPTGEKVFFRKRDDLAACGTNRDEIYANQFAANLLMPADEVRALHGRGHSLISLSRIFAVSAQAMSNRIVNLGLELA